MSRFPGLAGRLGSFASMKRLESVAIVGVGLIGGSIGLALRERKLAERVIGIGWRRGSLQVAKRRGAVTSVTMRLDHGVAEAELVVVCTPVELIAGHVLEVARHCPPGILITDVGSTKQQIVAELDEALFGGNERGVRFVGGHPIAGSERGGAEHARADLFVDRPAIVTPTRRTRAEDVAALTEFWEALGSRVLQMSPAQHDKTMASTSHLPHLVASVLAGTLKADEVPAVSSGFADTTRIASGDVDLWQEILLGNKANVLNSLGRFEKLLASLRRAIERGDRARITKILTDAKAKRDAVGS